LNSFDADRHETTKSTTNAFNDMDEPEAAMSVESEQLEILSNVLTQLESSPHDINLHAQHIKLTTQLGMLDQAQEAREMLTRLWPAGDEVWLPLIEHRLKAGIQSVNDAKAILELLNVAEFDFLCQYLSLQSKG
jgi:hypothetical protein